LVELVDDPKRREAMGAYGRRRVENELEWRYEVPKLLAAYAALERHSAAVLPRRDAATP
jgi:glycosyltransferase involved in cell wall biosynthesis